MNIRQAERRRGFRDVTQECGEIGFVHGGIGRKGLRDEVPVWHGLGQARCQSLQQQLRLGHDDLQARVIGNDVMIEQGQQPFAGRPIEADLYGQ